MWNWIQEAIRSCRDHPTALFVYFFPQGIAFVVSWGLTAYLIRLAPLLGLIDQPSERKVHTQPTPRGGGLAIFAGMYLASLSCSGMLLTPALGCSALIVLLGLIDDLRSLPWRLRLGSQIAIAALAVHWSAPNAEWLAMTVAVFWVVAMTNAFNMLDNMDALSGGVALIAAGSLAIVCLRVGDDRELLPTLLPLLVLMASLTGFLCFNFPPARIFMGDSGSTFLGFYLGIASLRLIRIALGLQPQSQGFSDATPWEWAVVLAIFAVPCYDMASVIFLRLKQGRSPFHADKQHLSHRLVERGLSKPAAVGVICLLGLTSGATGLALLVVRTPESAALIGASFVLWWIAFAVVEWLTWRRT